MRAALSRLLTLPAAPIAAAILAIALFSIMDALMKRITMELGALNAVFWRQLICLGLGSVLFFALRTPWPDRAAAQLHVLRGLAVTLASVTFFYGLKLMPLADAIALSFLAPILIVLLAAGMLGETIHPRALIGCGLGFAGALVIVAGQLQGVAGPEALLGAGAVLVSAASYAVAQVLLRKQATQDVPAASIAFLMPLIVTSVLAGPVALAPALPDGALWPWVFIAAVLTTISQLLLVWAYARAQAQIMAPLEYTAFLWAALLGWMMFKEPLTLMTLTGTGLIMIACFVATRR